MAFRPDYRKDRPYVVLYQGRIVLTAIAREYAEKMRDDFNEIARRKGR